MNDKSIFCVAFVSAIGLKVNVVAAERPNIILIYTDQQRYNTIAAMGNDEIVTPNLDRMVEMGTAFTHSFAASPVSVSSRWSLHSGMYPTSHGAYSNHHQVAPAPSTSLPEELCKAGYFTAVLGKNHCFLNKKRVDYMKSSPGFVAKPADKRSADEVAPWALEDDPMHVLTNRAIDMIGQKNSEGKPLFLWLSYLYPHTPYICPEPFYSIYANKELSAPQIEPEGLKAANKPFRQQFHEQNNNYFLPYDAEKTMSMKRCYYSMISMIDAEIGRLVAYLEENNLMENTILVFTSDHGDYMGDHGLYTKSPAMYDCLTRVPLLFVWKDKIKEANITSTLASATDLMPTLLDLIDCEVPQQAQGQSLRKALEGKRMKHKYVFSEYGIPGMPFSQAIYDSIVPMLKKKGIDYAKGIPWEGNPITLSGRIRMVRSHEFKLVEELYGTSELYDMVNDPHELNNLYGKSDYEREQRKLQRALNKWKHNIPQIMNDTTSLGRDDVNKLLINNNQ